MDIVRKKLRFFCAAFFFLVVLGGLVGAQKFYYYNLPFWQQIYASYFYIPHTARVETGQGVSIYDLFFTQSRLVQYLQQPNGGYQYGEYSNLGLIYNFDGKTYIGKRRSYVPTSQSSTVDARIKSASKSGNEIPIYVDSSGRWAVADNSLPDLLCSLRFAASFLFMVSLSLFIVGLYQCIFGRASRISP